MAKETMAEKFVDDTAVFRRLGDEAADYGITSETIRAQVAGLTAERLNQGVYQKWVHFQDGSDAAQVRGTRRWEVWR